MLLIEWNSKRYCFSQTKKSVRPAWLVILALFAILIAQILLISPALEGFASQNGANQTEFKLLGQSSVVIPGTNLSLNLSFPSAYSGTIKLKLFDRTPDLSNLQTESFNPTSILSQTQGITVMANSQTFNVPITNAPDVNNPSSLSLDCSKLCGGVYPLEITYYPNNKDLVSTSIYTYFAVQGGYQGNQLAVSLILNLPSQSKAQDYLPNENLSNSTVENVSSEINVLKAYLNIPIALNINPFIIMKLRSSPSGAKIVDELKSLLHQSKFTVLAPFYVPVSPLSLPASQINSDLAILQFKSKEIIRSMLGIDPIANVYVAQSYENRSTIEALRNLGYQYFVLPGKNVVPSDIGEASTQPFSLSSLPGLFMEEDPLILTGNPGQSISWPQFITAQYEQIYFDHPNSTELRAVITTIPDQLASNSAYMLQLLQSLQSNPLLLATDIESAFRAQIGIFSNPSARQLSNSVPGILAPTTPPQYAALSTKVSALISTVNTSTISQLVTNYTQFENAALVLLSNVVPLKIKQAWIAYVNSILNKVMQDISLPNSQSATLTANKGRIPITIFLKSSITNLKVEVALSGTGAEFPSGRIIKATLNKQVNTVYFLIQSRNSATYPLTINILSGDGSTTLKTGKLFVNSAYFSVIAVVISVIALFLLGVWWLRTGMKRVKRYKHSRKSRKSLVAV